MPDKIIVPPAASQFQIRVGLDITGTKVVVEFTQSISALTIEKKDAEAFAMELLKATVAQPSKIVQP